MVLKAAPCILAMQPESDAPRTVGGSQGQALALIPASGPDGLNPLSAVFRGRSRAVCVAVADFKASLEEGVSEHADDYAGLALLVELNVGVGCDGPAHVR